ncbi:unnamed protein product, partial [Closterium sp. Yama58-4]
MVSAGSSCDVTVEIGPTIVEDFPNLDQIEAGVMASDAAFLLPGIPDDAALMCFAMLPRGYYGVLKCVSRRWKAALEDEHLYSFREELQRKESWVYVNVYHHPLPSATTTSSSSSRASSFRGGKPPSQIRVDSLYAFSPILDRWFRLSQSTSPRSSRRIKTVAVKHTQYIFGDDLVIRDVVTGASAPGPQLPSDAYLNMHLAASDSHVVLVSTTPQVIFGGSDNLGDVVAHVLAVDEAGMPHGEWKRFPPHRWMGMISLLVHEGGLWHLIGQEAQGLQEAEEEEEEEEEEDGEDDDILREIEMRAAFLDGYTRVSSPGEVDCGEGPGGCHKKLLLQAAAACEALRRSRDSLRDFLLFRQGKDLQVGMRRLLTPGRLAIDDSGREPGKKKEGKENAKVGLLINEENVVRVLASGGTGMFRIIRDQMMIVPVYAGGGYLTGSAGSEGLDAGACIGAADACGTSEKAGVTMGSDAAFLLPGIPDDAALMCLAMLPRGCYGVLKCVSRRWKAALEDEHVYSLREQLGRKESWVYVNVYHHPPPSATTASFSSTFRGGKPFSQIRVDSLYAFSPILNRWFRLSETIASCASCRIKTVAVKHKQYIFGDDLIIRDAVTGACTSGPQLPSGAHLGVQLAASDSHVVVVSTSPQVVFGDPDRPGDVFVHVLAVDEAGMPHGEWQKLPPRRWTG